MGMVLEDDRCPQTLVFTDGDVSLEVRCQRNKGHLLDHRYEGVTLARVGSRDFKEVQYALDWEL